LLAQQRQFPAVDWGTSYSLQAERMSPWFDREGGPAWGRLRSEALELLQRGRELKDIAGLVGPEALQDADRLTLESARNIQELFLGQSAYDPNDAASPVAKTYRLATLVLSLHRAGLAALEGQTPFEQLEMGPARRALAAFRAAPPAEADRRAGEADQAIARIGGGSR
jgi:V/A-type H+-transporting ATPase subunit A